jgi:hypothetical protein
MHMMKSTAEEIGRGLLFDSQYSFGVKLLYAQSSSVEKPVARSILCAY